jgi:CrcB protein
MISLVYVFVGGGLGSVCRFGLSQWLNKADNYLPYGTFIANLISCLILGFLMGIALKNGLDSRSKLLLMTGFCGGFSTFSTFSGELFSMMQNGQIVEAMTYTIASLVLCTLCLMGAYFLAQQLN